LKKLLSALLLVLAALAYWLYQRASAPPELAFTRAERGRLESVLSTNGKVEPIEWAAARAEREGALERLAVTKGQTTAKGAVLATIAAGADRAELASARARVDQVQAEIALLDSGGRAADLSEIDNGLRRAQLDKATAEREIGVLSRLVEKKAAPAQELTEMRERLDRANLQIRSLEERRRALVDRSSLDAARARLREAEANAAQIERRLEKSVVRAPLSGVVYSLDLKPGAWITPGAIIASIGRVDRVKVNVYVDEPELGRVAAGMPVRITWDAQSGRAWKGAVERRPTEIVALGTRQVGEVVCVIENPGGDLLPGTNINAFIESKAVASALTIPKETLRREGGDLGVFTLNGDRLAWRKVTLGASSVTRSEVLAGLKDNDAVLLPTDEAVADGMLVQALFRR
jgi:HlyD family secretion protein